MPKNDLTKLTGVGPAVAKKLNSVGINTFEDVMKLDDKALDDLNENLQLRGAATANDWRGEAKDFKAQDEADEANAGSQDGEGAQETNAEKAKADNGNEGGDEPDLTQQTSKEAFGGEAKTEGSVDEISESHLGAGAPVPRGAVASGGTDTGAQPGHGQTPTHEAPDQTVEKVNEALQRGEGEGQRKGVRLNEKKPYGEVAGRLEGYDQAVKYEQDGKLFGIDKIEVKRSTRKTDDE